MKLITQSLTLAIGLAFSAGAMAQSMTDSSYRSAKDRIEAEYKSEKAKCDALSDNAKDICVADAKGKEKVGKAELTARYRNTPKNHYDVHEAKAEATYEVAKEKCDDLNGNDKDVCMKEAKAAQTRAKADAEARMKVSKADKKAGKESSEIHNKAAEKKSDARNEAAVDKREANYELAKEKCDSYTGDVKQNCQDQAKRNYGKD